MERGTFLSGKRNIFQWEEKPSPARKETFPRGKRNLISFGREIFPKGRETFLSGKRNLSHLGKNFPTGKNNRLLEGRKCVFVEIEIWYLICFYSTHFFTKSKFLILTFLLILHNPVEILCQIKKKKPQKLLNLCMISGKSL